MTTDESIDMPNVSPLADSKASSFRERLEEAGIYPSNISESMIGGIAFTFLEGNVEIFVEFLNNGNVYAAVSNLGDSDENFLAYQIDDDDVGFGNLIGLISNPANA
jgi:hypothetical protein